MGLGYRICNTCAKVCHSSAGLDSHLRSHGSSYREQIKAMETRELTKEFQDLGMVPKIDDVEMGNICAVKATNRQALIDQISKFVDSSFFDGTNGKAYLHVELSGERLGCKGCFADYSTEADVPSHSVPCACGNPNHWLIKYEEN